MLQTRKKKKSQTSKVPNSKKILELYDACMINAYDLIDEAKLLLENRRYARSFFLALTAYEEIGKAQLTADYFNECVSPEEFIKSFSDHNIKISYNSRYALIEDLKKHEVILEYNPEDADDYKKLRMASLYVAYKKEKNIFTPKKEFDKEIAEKMIEQVLDLLYEIEHAIWLNDRIGSKGLFK